MLAFFLGGSFDEIDFDPKNVKKNLEIYTVKTRSRTKEIRCFFSFLVTVVVVVVLRLNHFS